MKKSIVMIALVLAFVLTVTPLSSYAATPKLTLHYTIHLEGETLHLTTILYSDGTIAAMDADGNNVDEHSHLPPEYVPPGAGSWELSLGEFDNLDAMAIKIIYTMQGYLMASWNYELFGFMP